MNRVLPAHAIARALGVCLILGLAAGAIVTGQARPGSQNAEAPLFTGGVEVVNVTATVFDGSDRFVPNLRQEDFLIYEDGVAQPMTAFSADRVPVSLGIVLDTSGSMAGEKIDAARSALDRFLYDLLDKNDDVFLYRFDDTPTLLQTWTSDRLLISRALGRMSTPRGGTALYDAVAESLPLATAGRHAKKAILLISDGNDTSSLRSARVVKEAVQESEVLIYAVGIAGAAIEIPKQEEESPPHFPRAPERMPSPFPPGTGRRPGRFPGNESRLFDPAGAQRVPQRDERVNVDALRGLTDDSGGRTEVVRSPRDLTPATVSIADELSRQYQLAYTSAGRKDGRWHSIRVEVKRGAYRVRARSGYLAN